MPVDAATALLLVLVLCSLAQPAAAQANHPYLIGRGMADITGPVVGLQLWGFGRDDQIGEGLHIRQRARAFIVAQGDRPARRLAFVSADLGSIDHHIALTVIERLRQKYAALYSLDNVIISATHTHAGPGGYWHSRTDTGLDGGLYPAHFKAIVAGITAAIVRAHEDLQPGSVYINRGIVTNAGVNRSAIAYDANPTQERARYTQNTNREMLLLKFVDDSGVIGMLNWYALHPTAMNFHNRLVSGDHKGYASLQAERGHGATYDRADDFVAAFAQSDAGDVTPNDNLDNTGPGDTDVETTQIMGERQLAVARELFDGATEPLKGPVVSRHTYANLERYAVDDRFTGQGTRYTCPSAYGYSFAGGSTEDGGAHFLFKEGMTEQQWWLDLLVRTVTGAPKWTEAVKACQAPKPILFETGSQDPPLQSQIRSVSVARIGQLVILAMPGEVTTMAGRRLRDSVMAELGDWAEHIVIAGYANGFAGYVTTREEYQLQQYEAAHNLHGQWSLSAYRQIAGELAALVESGAPAAPKIPYDDWRGKATELALPRGDAAALPAGKTAGDALAPRQSKYKPGDTATVAFLSVNPTAHYVTGNNFLTVERKTADGWQAIADDNDWHTRVRWRMENGGTTARVEWDIPADTHAGEYRVRHTGFKADGEPFAGVSQVLRVES